MWYVLLTYKIYFENAFFTDARGGIVCSFGENNAGLQVGYIIHFKVIVSVILNEPLIEESVSNILSEFLTLRVF